MYICIFTYIYIVWRARAVRVEGAHLVTKGATYVIHIHIYICIYIYMLHLLARAAASKSGALALFESRALVWLQEVPNL